MGTLYVKREKYGWRVIQETYVDKKRVCKTIPKQSYEALGISSVWTLSEAQDYVKSLNKRSSIKRKDQEKIIGAARRVRSITEINSAFLPPELMQGFLTKLSESSFGNQRHSRKMLSHWKTCCKLIAHLKLDSSEFFDETNSIYQYFISKHLSSDYSKKLIRVLNMWGHYIAKHRGVTYKPVKNPTGYELTRIEETYQSSDTYRGESDPLTPKHLVEQRYANVEWYNWLCISVWFGLRPIEIDGLKDQKNWRLERIRGTNVLWIYQSKLTKIKREKRWKPIPCIFPEQINLLPVIKLGSFKRPLLKTLHRILKTDRIDLRGGRKGFTDLMFDRGQSLEDVSTWLGHQSIEMTWQKYRNKKRVSWKAG